MELHDIKAHLQEHLSDGLAVIVGSGLSCAEGIPSMGGLAEHLKNAMPALISESDKALWSQVCEYLDAGKDLETALLNIKVSENLERVIIDVTHAHICLYENKIIDEVFCQGRKLRFAKLLPHLLKPSAGIPIITTNYDRLIEVAAESVGLSVNNTFSGKYISFFNPRESKFSLCRGVIQRAKKVLLNYAEFISVYKPHGSVDWFLINDEPVCSALCTTKDKLIITPGINKFRGGYERPFDAHREMANKSIDKASRFLIIGYGFNDDHLQVHLDRQLEKGKPAVVITHSISDKFKSYVEDKENVWTICSRDAGDGFLLFVGKNSYDFEDCNIWDLEIFVKEVLE